MSDTTHDRSDVMRRVQLLRDSTEKPAADDDALEAALASFHTELPKGWLTEALLATGNTFTGYLYHVRSRYVYEDWSARLLYAGKPTTGGAVFFAAYRDPLGHLVLQTAEEKPRWFNWRTVTGACKLYASPITIFAANWHDGVQFNIYYSTDEYVGTKYETTNELYCSNRVVSRDFQFELYDEERFSKDDHLIYSAYMKQRSAESPST